jgi:hypothetical protein
MNIDICPLLESDRIIPILSLIKSSVKLNVYVSIALGNSSVSKLRFSEIEFNTSCRSLSQIVHYMC